jgi:hypothetical protein
MKQPAKRAGALWEIINRVGNLVDWSPTPSTVLTATQHAA